MDTQNAGQKPPSNEIISVTLDLWSQSEVQHFIPIVGRSMYPLIDEGDFVLVSHGNTQIRCGDIVIFRLEEVLITHRVLAITHISETGFEFHTKGDNSSYLDPALKTNDILGRVLAIKRGERLLSIDNPIWHWLNMQIANAMLVSNRSYHRKINHQTALSRFLPTSPILFLQRIQGIITLSIFKNLLILIRW